MDDTSVPMPVAPGSKPGAAARRPAKSQPVAKKPASVTAPAAAPLPPVAAAPADPLPAIPEPAPMMSAPVQPPIEEVIMDTNFMDAAVNTQAAMEDTVKSTADKGQAMLNDVKDRAAGAMEKGTKMLEEMTAFGKGNVEAIVESTQIAAKGFEALGQDAAAYAKKSMEDATNAAKTLASVKSPVEFFKLQGDYMRSAFDAMVAETSKSTESMLKLAGDVSQPISNRIAIAADKMKVAA